MPNFSEEQEKTREALESKVLSLDILPEESVRTQPSMSHEMINIVPVIVKLFLNYVYCLLTHRYWIVIKDQAKGDHTKEAASCAFFIKAEL